MTSRYLQNLGESELHLPNFLGSIEVVTTRLVQTSTILYILNMNAASIRILKDSGYIAANINASGAKKSFATEH